MPVTQTVEIPASHRLTIDVPREVPAGAVILTFTPKASTACEDWLAKTNAACDDWFSNGGECPICAAHRDPVTGEELFNAETVAAIEEGRAMMRGEIPTKWYNSLDEMWEDLIKEDDDD
jgi:hypothetical protein